MTNPTDLIRRGDAYAACELYPPDDWDNDERDGFFSATSQCRAAIRALPAHPVQEPPSPAPVVPAEGLDPERLVMAWMAEQEGFATRGERFMDTIMDSNDVVPWLHAACQVGIEAALRSAPPVGARVKPLVWEDQTCGSYCWVQGLHYYTEGSDEDRDWYVSCMIDGIDVWQGENQPTRGECKALAQADYEARILAALLPAGEGE